MENDSAPNARQARDALAAIGAARSDAAGRLVTPWWYHPVLGLLAAVFVVAMTLGGIWVMIVVMVVYFAGIAALMAACKEKTGVGINGLTAGKASWWTLPLMAVMVAGMGWAYYLHAGKGLHWPAWVAGAAVFGAVNVFGRLFDRAVRARLRGTP